MGVVYNIQRRTVGKAFTYEFATAYTWKGLVSFVPGTYPKRVQEAIGKGVGVSFVVIYYYFSKKLTLKYLYFLLLFK
jgi:hypothetical protein